ncbi:trichosurin-like [Trichosurus vulpecula]|uniref:trichosurin-like n=1 Tax=Trichosurus vulpecula TaxID=9337 RepID=UPI00186AFF20|nr:trichosurin-like [Trichosurus vulpecula]
MKILMLSVGLALICGLQALSDNMEDPQMVSEQQWEQVDRVVWKRCEDHYSSVVYCHLKSAETIKLQMSWFTVALASNVSSKIEEGGGLQLFVKSLGERDGVLIGDFFKRENGKCIQFSLTTYKGEDDEMHVFYDGDNNFSVQSTDSQHVIFITYNTKGEEVTVWGELYGRTPDLSDEIKKKFEEICENFGIRKDQIRDLSNDDRCEQLRTS